MTYLAKVPDALTPSVTGLKWFKIHEDGMTADGKFGTDRMFYNKGKVTFKMPECIAPGQYLMRSEAVALHGASSYPGAQFYVECAQINVVGGTGTGKPQTVSFPGAYKGTDPGVKINIYNPKPTSCECPLLLDVCCDNRADTARRHCAGARGLHLLSR